MIRRSRRSRRRWGIACTPNFGSGTELSHVTGGHGSHRERALSELLVVEVSEFKNAFYPSSVTYTIQRGSVDLQFRSRYFIVSRRNIQQNPRSYSAHQSLPQAVRRTAFELSSSSHKWHQTVTQTMSAPTSRIMSRISTQRR
jgi:hypothetical protein